MTRSDARKRLVPPTGPHAPTAGDEGGALSEADREALIDWWDSDWPDTKGGALGTLYAAVESIVAAHRVEPFARVTTLLGIERCADVHGGLKYLEPCASCQSWAAHVTDALLDVPVDHEEDRDD